MVSWNTSDFELFRGWAFQPDGLFVLVKTLRMVWASPNSLIGLVVGGTGLLFGGRVQVRRGCLEFYGGLVGWLLRRTPLGPGVAAMTLGHTILGQTPHGLEVARDHEHVHVRQYERWGPLFLPAYLGCSLWLWSRGSDPYRDNPFEKEAYGLAGLHPLDHEIPPHD